MIKDRGRILAIDPGEVNIGLAVSDLSQTIANPLLVFPHVARAADVARIAALAKEKEVVAFIIGGPFGDGGTETPGVRHAQTLANALQTLTGLPVTLWDESNTTKEAIASRVIIGVPRSRRGGHHDAIAATILLQSYLDTHPPED